MDDDSEGEGKSGMKELTSLVSKVLTRIADFFNIFDLSFFVSGALSLSALFFAFRLAGVDVFQSADYKQQAATVVFLILLACYVVGLVSFSGARLLRNRLRSNTSPSRQEMIRKAVLEHDLASAYPAYRLDALDGEERADALYTLMWVELREDKKLGESFLLINRYWVMAATYDGLGLSFLCWSVLMLVSCGLKVAAHFGAARAAIEWPLLVGGLLLAVAFGAAVLGCYREAWRLTETQVNELVATMAFRRRREAARKLAEDTDDERYPDSEDGTEEEDARRGAGDDDDDDDDEDEDGEDETDD